MIKLFSIVGGLVVFGGALVRFSYKSGYEDGRDAVSIENFMRRRGY